MHFYPHHIGDYNRDTAHLSIVEHGAYRLLMDSYYSTERPLPADHAMLCRIVRATSKAERDAVAAVARLFFREQAGNLIHSRIERELSVYNAQREQASRAGKMSAMKRQSVTNSQRPFNDRSTTVEFPLERNGNGGGNGTSTNQEPLTKNHDPRTIEETKTPKSPSSSTPEFDEFWKHYPRREGKHNALKAWNKIKPDIEQVKAALEWQTISDDWQKDDGKFVPHAATYLNQRRYEDENPNGFPAYVTFSTSDDPAEDPDNLLAMLRRPKVQQEEQPPSPEELNYDLPDDFNPEDMPERW